MTAPADGTAEAPELVIDTCGKFCPVPILEMGKAIQRAQKGQVVRLLATDPGVRSDLPAWCKATRHELLELHEEQGRFQIRVRKS